MGFRVNSMLMTAKRTVSDVVLFSPHGFQDTAHCPRPTRPEPSDFVRS